MKNAIGIVLRALGVLIGLITVVAALAYVALFVAWMHAPLPDVLRVTAITMLPPLGLAWACGKIGGHLLRSGARAAPSPNRSAMRSAMTRGFAAVFGIAVAAACVSIGRTGLNRYKCSIGPAPGTPAALEAYARKQAETRKNGFERVCDGDLDRYDISFRPIARATRDLAFTPVDLTHTPFARLDSLGGRAEYEADVPSILYRGFRLPDGHVLTLSEHDMSADGSSTWRDPKDEPERINGMPARLGIFEDASGSAVSNLSWVEGRRDYELWIDANVARVPLQPLRRQLFALAASLPRAVPACPHEVPPKPFVFDKDGKRIEEAPPAVLTQAQVDAMVDRGRRPCK